MALDFMENDKEASQYLVVSFATSITFERLSGIAKCSGNGLGSELSSTRKI